MRRPGFLVAFLVSSLLVAGVASYYASSHPDGLERVGEQVGFLDSAEDSAASESPFADYDTAGVESERLGGGIAGVTGALVVLLVMVGVAYGLRRRGHPHVAHAESAETPADGSRGV